jgi:homogentisate 1,2-dioxygenase
MVGPGEIAVVQRGIKWKVSLPDGPARGCEPIVIPRV